MSLELDFPWIEVGAADPSAPQGFVRNRMVKLDELLKWRDRYSNKGVYCTAYRYKAEDKQGELFGHMYFDFDSKDDFSKVKADAIRFLVILEALFGIKSEDCWIFFSGQKGVHITVPAAVIGIQPHQHLNEIFKFIAAQLSSQVPNKTIDLKVYDRVRLFRLPNSQHQKSGLYKVPLTADELIHSTHEQILELARAPRSWSKPPLRYGTKAAVAYQGYVKQWEASKLAQKFSREGGTKTLDFTPPCIKHIMLNGAEDGKRNHTLAALANHFKQLGRSEDHTVQLLIDWNNRRVSPPVAESEVLTTVHSIFARDYYYGCTTLETLAPCDQANCKFGKYKT